MFLSHTSLIQDAHPPVLLSKICSPCGRGLNPALLSLVQAVDKMGGKFYNPFMRKGKRQTVAIAESCTGGLLGHLLTETPGASDYFRGGVIAYSNRVKTSLLGVSGKILKKQGAVSDPVARQMAKGVRRKMKADIGLGITGIAGPGGGSKERPVGLVYIALSKKGTAACKRFLFSGKRSTIKKKAAQKALVLLRAFLR